MSGIVGILNLDGAPVDAALLARMTQFLAPRGPDTQRTWTERNAGLGHTLLITDPSSAQHPQPLTLDGHAWITADVRLDARNDLLDKLLRRTSVDAAVSDAQLVLHAYKSWGEECVDHLRGEFVFAIWDNERQHLFCAHDQLGTRPLYFAHMGRQVVFSNTLDCVRKHPAVSSRINDAAIGDFLLFGLNYNPETTSFADIRRLPPGHVAIWDPDSFVQRRYWQMPIDEPLFYRRRRDYIDQFQSLLKTAVSERLPAGKIGISLSGGLDSALLAAVACDSKMESGSKGDVFAVTNVYDRLIPDRERYYSSLVARHLRIPHHFLVMDGPAEEAMWSQIPEPRTEPAHLPWTTKQNRRDCGRLASLGRVYFYGEGPDNALHYEWKPYLEYLARQRQWGRLVKDVGQHIWLHRRVPLLATLPRMVLESRARDASEAELPQWLNPEFSARLRLDERRQEMWTKVLSEHTVRPSGYASFKSPLWQYLFESCDSSDGQFPIEFRHPYLSLPLLRFMLALPALPWCRVKYIQRVASQKILPADILNRPKAPLAGFPEVEITKRKGVPPILPSGALLEYIVPDKIHPNTPLLSALMDNLRTVSLSYWLYDLTGHSENNLENAYGTKQGTGV